jgi:DNA-binding NarL/FixJ family response regulator
VDDHPIVRRGFQLLISLERDMMVCGEADNERTALDKIPTVKPDLAIVDLRLRAGTGLELIKQLHDQCPKLKILVFSMRDEVIYAERALRSGAHGYITKEEGPEQAIAAIRLLMLGKPYLSERIAARMLETMAGGGPRRSDSIESLSDRELEILEQIGNGRCSREIAGQLHITIKTVESHREHIKAKLSLKNASELVSYAFDRFRAGRTVGVAPIGSPAPPVPQPSS